MPHFALLTYLQPRRPMKKHIFSLLLCACTSRPVRLAVTVSHMCQRMVEVRLAVSVKNILNFTTHNHVMIKIMAKSYCLASHSYEDWLFRWGIKFYCCVSTYVFKLMGEGGRGADFLVEVVITVCGLPLMCSAVRPIGATGNTWCVSYDAALWQPCVFSLNPLFIISQRLFTVTLLHFIN